MKKIFVAAIVVSMALAACGKKKSADVPKGDGSAMGSGSAAPADGSAAGSGEPAAAGSAM